MPSLTSLPSTADIQRSRAAAAQGPAHVVEAVREASARTGVDFAYLMEKAAVESSFKADAKASTSSATGLYQFIDSTWLNTVAQHGAKHGLGQYATAINRRGDGTPYVADPEMRREILDLRKDPRLSALLAAEFTRDNKMHLEQTVGGDIGSTELYLAHFLGSAGAAKFLNAMKQNPDRPAAELFPEASAANRGVFYDREAGKAQSLAQIYNRFADRFDEENTSVAALTGGAPGRGGLATASANPLRVLAGQPLDMFTVLTLNALETPLDEERDRRDDDQRRVRDEMAPVQSGTTASLRSLSV